MKFAGVRTLSQAQVAENKAYRAEVLDQLHPTKRVSRKPHVVAETQLAYAKRGLKRRRSETQFGQLGLVLVVNKDGVGFDSKLSSVSGSDPRTVGPEECGGFGGDVGEVAADSGRYRTHLAINSRCSDDPVIHELSKALVAVERSGSGDHRLCVDALKLAVTLRLAALRHSRHAVPNLQSCKERNEKRHCVQALQRWRLKRVIEYIDDRLSEKITLSDLATEAGLSTMYFAAQFRAATGYRPHEYVLWQRVQRAKQMLRTGKMSIVEIALEIGFQSQAHFTTTFKRFAGITPSHWRRAASSEFDHGYGLTTESRPCHTAEHI